MSRRHTGHVTHHPYGKETRVMCQKCSHEQKDHRDGVWECVECDCNRFVLPVPKEQLSMLRSL